MSTSPTDSTVLVTGGLGRLGRYVVDALRRNHRVIVVDRDLGCGDQDVRAADICDYPALRDAMRDASGLIHLAGIDASVSADASETFRVNTLGTWNAFRAAEELGYRKVVFCSSVAVHGLDSAHAANRPRQLPITESAAPAAYHAYGLSKRLGEEAAQALYRRTGIDTIVLRPAYVLFPELRHSVLFRVEFGEAVPGESRTDKAGALREPVPLLRGYVLPEDAAAAFCLAMERGRGFGVYHLAAADVLGSRSLRQIVRDAFGDDCEISFADLYRREPRAAPYDSSSACRELGWQPSTIASSGFEPV